MDIKQLEAFVLVLETRSFSRAGELLHLTQPTISAHIAALERETNVKLIVRNSSDVHASEAGQILYSYAKDILKLRDESLLSLAEYSQHMKGTILVAASSIPGQYFLPALLQSFREKYPDILFDVQLTDSDDVIHKVAGRAADIGFCGTSPDNKKCIGHPFADDCLVLITPNEQHYQDYQHFEYFPPEQILKEPFICREAGSGTRKEMEQFLTQMGINPSMLNMVVAVPSTETIIKMVSEGLGVSIISKSACKDYCAFHKILAFELGAVPMKRNLYLVKHKSSMLSPIAQVFYDYARSFFKNNKNNPEIE